MGWGSWLKLGFVAILVGLIAWFYTSGTYEELDPDRMRGWMRGAS